MKPRTQAKPANNPAAKPKGRSQTAAKATAGPSAKSSGRRIQVRRSGVHGKGVFALQPIEPGERLIEYTGQVIDWPEALRRHPHDPSNPEHTFYFQIEGGNVIDALYGGNAARWINHACDPNCEADEQDGRVFIKALRPIAPGEELFYDYGLTIDERYTPKLKKRYECRCGAADCRGTMLSPKTRQKASRP
ncbi:SET domain-containing protein-lysine N-methyltransferase [Ideonella azotifigens]|uniref:SET domain-containing protein-lysine N-methyltransferase n=1 Tax=Ideonella azotifigens TaxID=513160 RepID=A0ABP3UVU2_9BURK|nr:SET domain-containing protein-lysine N-methyltransferase [Ideonella azotifigens]MCD2339697.1 SET domain-containing protein-lysine N-methyltransferase [Ideonella azotifigens]